MSDKLFSLNLFIRDSIFFAIAAACIVTALIRCLPIFLLSGRTLPFFFNQWLAFIPPAVLASILTGELLNDKTTTSFGISVAILAFISTFIIGLVTRSLFITVLASIFSYLLFQML